MEVLSTPSPDFTPPTSYVGNDENDEKEITSDDIAKLNAIFNMRPEDAKRDAGFYDALEEAFGDKQVRARTPISMAQNWVLANDPAFNEQTSTFTTSDTRHVDKAYEYVFNTLAMTKAESPVKGQRSYIVLPEFLPNSSYSFDRFAGLVMGIINSLPSIKDALTISTFHPEHVSGHEASPVPILVVTWN